MKHKRKVILPLIVLGGSLVSYLFHLLLSMQASTLFWLATFVYAFLAWRFGREYDQLSMISERDFLTNVYNRRNVLPIFHRLTKLADMRSAKVLALFIDLNNFKLVNDTLGHHIGDLVLQQVAEELKCAFSGKEQYVFRWGGDEFIVLLPISYDFNLDMLQKYLCRKLEQHQEELPIRVAFSIGHAIYPDEGTLLEEMVSIADQRMYQQKNTSKKG